MNQGLWIRKSIRNNRGSEFVLLTHGLGEHSGRYPRFFDLSLLPEPLAGIYGYDLRGHGQSVGRRGHIENFSDYLGDLAHVVEVIAHENSEVKKIHLFGHSLGGLITLRFLMEMNQLLPPSLSSKTASAFLSAPGLKIKMPIPSWKKWLGQGLSQIYGKLLLPTGMKFGDLTHDLQEIEALKRDPLSHQLASARYFTEFLKNQDLVLSWKGPSPVPMCILIPGADPVIDPDVTDIFSRQMKIQPHRIEGGFHELFNESPPYRQDAQNALKKFWRELLIPPH